MIKAVELSKRFGDFQAVRSISLEVHPGEVLALLGPNGAGKTTTIRMLAAILQPTSGTASIGGFDVIQQAREVRHAVGLLTEFPGLYHRMKALEYLLFFGRLQGMHDAPCLERATKLLKQFDLWKAHDKRIDSYSKGMKQKLALIRALIHDPNILYLDEPTTAMDPHSARTVRDAIASLRNERRSIILCTHNLPEAESLADRIAIIHDGAILAQGNITELSNQLMGAPIWHVQVADPHYELAALLQDIVTIETQGPGWVEYRTLKAEEINPVLVQRLQQAHVPLVSLYQVARSLEDVYLQIVGQTHIERVGDNLNGKATVDSNDEWVEVNS